MSQEQIFNLLEDERILDWAINQYKKSNNPFDLEYVNLMTKMVLRQQLRLEGTK
jgi:hypothetical protein